MSKENVGKRFVVRKESGSRFAFVHDLVTETSRAKFDVLKQRGGVDGWTLAERLAERLNREDAK